MNSSVLIRRSCLLSKHTGQKDSMTAVVKLCTLQPRIPPTACSESLSLELLMSSHLYLLFVFHWIKSFQLCGSVSITACHTSSRRHIFSTVSLHPAISQAHSGAIISDKLPLILPLCSWTALLVSESGTTNRIELQAFLNIFTVAWLMHFFHDWNWKLTIWD